MPKTFHDFTINEYSPTTLDYQEFKFQYSRNRYGNKFGKADLCVNTVCTTILDSDIKYLHLFHAI